MLLGAFAFLGSQIISLLSLIGALQITHIPVHNKRDSIISTSIINDRAVVLWSYGNQRLENAANKDKFSIVYL